MKDGKIRRITAFMNGKELAQAVGKIVSPLIAVQGDIGGPARFRCRSVAGGLAVPAAPWK